MIYENFELFFLSVKQIQAIFVVAVNRIIFASPVTFDFFVTGVVALIDFVILDIFVTFFAVVFVVIFFAFDYFAVIVLIVEFPF